MDLSAFNYIAVFNSGNFSYGLDGYTVGSADVYTVDFGGYHFNGLVKEVSTFFIEKQNKLVRLETFSGELSNLRGVLFDEDNTPICLFLENQLERG